MAGKTIVVLGGGVGGVVAANRLRRLLAKEHRVVLVDRNVFHYFAPAFPSVMLGGRTMMQTSADLRRLERKGIEFIAAEISGIDVEKRTVDLSGRTLDFDYLVISLGAQYSAGEVPGFGPAALTFYHPEGADYLREELPKFRSGRLALVIPATPYKCPAAPYEGALLLDDYFRRRRVRDEVAIHMYTPEPAPLPVAGEAVGQRVVEILGQRDISFSPGMKLAAADKDAKRLTFADGSEVPYDMLIAVPFHEAPSVIRDAGLLGESGWIEVDRNTLATAHEGVYAIGDVTMVTLPDGRPLPKAGVFAHGEAEVVARNIAAEIEDADTRWDFGGEGACFLETSRSKAAYVTGKFYAEGGPDVSMRGPGRLWHWMKEGFVRTWLWRWF